MNWMPALEAFCDRVDREGQAYPWIVVGSVGSLLQGAEMTPNDLDIYVQHKDDVSKLATLLEPFSLRAKSDRPHGDSAWLSSVEEPCFTQSFPGGFTWTKGKWIIREFPVEVVQISNPAGIPDSDAGDGIWEGGSFIWSLAKYVDFKGYEVPVVPLEIQLESNLRRNRQDRTEAIIHALRTNGYDRDLLSKALSTANLERMQPYGLGGE